MQQTSITRIAFAVQVFLRSTSDFFNGPGANVQNINGPGGKPRSSVSSSPAARGCYLNHPSDAWRVYFQLVALHGLLSYILTLHTFLRHCHHLGNGLTPLESGPLFSWENSNTTTPMASCSRFRMLQPWVVLQKLAGALFQVLEASDLRRFR